MFFFFFETAQINSLSGSVIPVQPVGSHDLRSYKNKTKEKKKKKTENITILLFCKAYTVVHLHPFDSLFVRESEEERRERT